MPATDHPYRRGGKKPPTLEHLEEHLDPIERTVRDLIGIELGRDLAEVPMDAALVEDLGADSLDVVEIAMAVETAFRLPEIDEEAVDGFVRVRDVVAYVRRRAKGAA